MIPVVISDIHSRKNKLMDALEQAGVFFEGNRNPGFQLIQVGDAVSAGYGMKEADFYLYWVSLLEPQDVELVGNHEQPILCTNHNIRFYGFDMGDMGTDGCDVDLIHEVLSRRDRYVGAYAVNGWLITHAGVYSDYLKGETAEEAAEWLNEQWLNQNHNSLCMCPYCDPNYGPCWARNLEKTNHEPSRIKQMFGHTPDGPTLSKGGTMWNIDTPRLTPPGSQINTRSEAEAWGGVCVMRWDDATSDWEKFYVS